MINFSFNSIDAIPILSCCSARAMLSCPVGEFLQIINENMPKLTQLELFDLNLYQMDTANMIHFKNVTTLVLRLKESEKVLRKIRLSFGKLEELSLFGFERSRVAVMNFVTKMKVLIKLDFKPTRGYGDIDADLGEIATKLMKLKDVTISDYGSTFTIGALKQFASNCKSLQKLRIRFFYEDDGKQNEVMKEITNTLHDWNVQKSSRNCKPHGIRYDLILTRKEEDIGVSNLETIVSDNV